ncbi:helix-turn-helix transcriptional regulator [Campylobacter fetus]|uniref:helix-turn-helix transcriptional regulator n=1 Tax=Campylobacter fetus TaxID=196 RepID=UPI0003C29DC8|nr:helix-turn-helix transcriptional regulator [Campylobacter fetus]AGZ82235.1 transcriptional regulator, XRE family [Campylobacter fetus subsp. testudinum 03-427]AJB45963.1 XRE family transcriptional regulator [Campylobacter fetus subsp. testudinum]EAI4322126.1 helix-turn-helix transcriptional regulator [Campylobacter fetus]EAI4391760.1 helix-turn-helix transcriptional regulator [Campylobacter fetus]OCS06504.1 XRE family transcriptional regulator [Campylobacter fetus subsp. testudinum]
MLNLPEVTTEQENEEFFNLVANNIKKIRQARGLSQLETALSIGQASSGFYANMENNAHAKHFNLLHLFKLSKLFDCDICEFFKEEDNRI